MSKDSVQIDQLQCEHTQSAWLAALYKWCHILFPHLPIFFFSYIIYHLRTSVDALIFVSTLHTQSALPTTHYSWVISCCLCYCWCVYTFPLLHGFLVYMLAALGDTISACSRYNLLCESTACCRVGFNETSKTFRIKKNGLIWGRRGTISAWLCLLLPPAVMLHLQWGKQAKILLTTTVWHKLPAHLRTLRCDCAWFALQRTLTNAVLVPHLYEVVWRFEPTVTADTSMARLKSISLTLKGSFSWLTNMTFSILMSVWINPRLLRWSRALASWDEKKT